MPGFDARVRPDQVTFTMRCRLARKVYCREFCALAAVFVPCLLIAAALAAFYYFHAEAAGSVWQLVSPIVLTGILLAVIVHLWGVRERKFIERAPLAAATVKEIESSSGMAYAHRLILSYRPVQHRATRVQLPGLSPSCLVIASVESDLPGFSRTLQLGDSVSVIYDPAEPDHVCIVEEEIAVEAMHPSAA